MLEHRTKIYLVTCGFALLAVAFDVQSAAAFDGMPAFVFWLYIAAAIFNGMCLGWVAGIAWASNRFVRVEAAYQRTLDEMLAGARQMAAKALSLEMEHRAAIAALEELCVSLSPDSPAGKRIRTILDTLGEPAIRPTLH